MANYTANAKGGTFTLTTGNDTVTLGKGVDVIRVGLKHGTNNVVTGYDSSKDILEIAKGINPNAKGVKGYSFVGNDLIMRLGETKIRLRNMAGKEIRFRAQGSSKVEKVNFYQDLPKNTSRAKNGKTIDWTKVVANSSFSGKFDMRNYNENLKTFDARSTTHKIDVHGSDGNDIIYGGSYNVYNPENYDYGNALSGNGGDDTIYCGNGANTVLGGAGNNTIYFGKGRDHLDRHADYGNDTIYNFNAKQDWIWLHKDCGDIKNVAVDGKDLVITIGQSYKQPSHGNGSVRIKGGAFMGGIKIDGVRKNQRKWLGQTLSYNSKTRKLKVLATDIADIGSAYKLADYAANALTLDAGNLKIKATLKGNNLNNTIIAGQKGSNIYAGKGNDKITCGAGADTIYYLQNDGSETINNFNAKQDVVKISKDCGTIKSVALDGRDVVVTLGQNKANKLNGTLRFKNAAQQNNILIQGPRAGQSKKQAQIVSYTSGNGTLKALTTNVGGTYDLKAYSVDAMKLDAGNLKVKVKLLGNAQDNTIIAGWTGGDIRGGIGNDKITCGNGADRIWFGKDDGKDTVLKSGKNDVAYLYGVKDINKVTKKFAKGVMSLGIKGSKDTLNISGWKAGSSLATVELANGKKYTFGANGAFKLTK